MIFRFFNWLFGPKQQKHGYWHQYDINIERHNLLHNLSNNRWKLDNLCECNCERYALREKIDRQEKRLIQIDKKLNKKING